MKKMNPSLSLLVAGLLLITLLKATRAPNFASTGEDDLIVNGISNSNEGDGEVLVVAETETVIGEAINDEDDEGEEAENEVLVAPEVVVSAAAAAEANIIGPRVGPFDSCVDPTNFTIVYENSDFFHMIEAAHNFENHNFPAFLVTWSDLTEDRLDFLSTYEKNRKHKKRMINLVLRLDKKDLNLLERSADNDLILRKMISRIKKAFKSKTEDSGLHFVYSDFELSLNVLAKLAEADLKIINSKTWIFRPEDVQTAAFQGIVFVSNKNFYSSQIHQLSQNISSLNPSMKPTSLFKCLQVEHGKSTQLIVPELLEMIINI